MAFSFWPFAIWSFLYRCNGEHGGYPAPGPALSRQSGRALSIAAALGLLALSFPLLGLVHGQAPFFSLAVSLGVGWGLTSPLCNALMFQYSPPALRGLNTNYLMEMQQAGFFAGPFVGGVIVAHWGLEVLFSICGLLAFAVCLGPHRKKLRLGLAGSCNSLVYMARVSAQIHVN